jgi:hypothetical protein
MILIQSGDRGPRVVLAQILLNRHGAKPKLRVDGVWGDKTQTAVEAFRKASNLEPGGPIDADAWKPLIAGQSLKLVDSVDVSSLTFQNKETGKQETLLSGSEPDAKALKEGGGAPLLMTRHPLSGLEDAIQRIITYVGNDDEIALLRFHGHGNHGYWFTVEAGDPVDLKEKDPKAYRALAADWHGYLSNENFHKHKLTLAKLKPYFAKFASVEHHGCNVGKHSQPLLHKLANLWGVPVSAGQTIQYGAGKTAYVFEGTPFTAYPHHKNLKSWAHSVAE